MSRERKPCPKEFKLMNVELSNSRTDLTGLANELNIKVSLSYCWRKEFSNKQRISVPSNREIHAHGLSGELPSAKITICSNKKSGVT